jgi:hypothetical protein
MVRHGYNMHCLVRSMAVDERQKYQTSRNGVLEDTVSNSITTFLDFSFLNNFLCIVRIERLDPRVPFTGFMFQSSPCVKGFQ